MALSDTLLVMNTIFQFAWLFVLGFSLFGDSISCKDEASGLFNISVISFVFGPLSTLSSHSLK
jgi:hypothetical protein